MGPHAGPVDLFDARIGQETQDARLTEGAVPSAFCTALCVVTAAAALPLLRRSQPPAT